MADNPQAFPSDRPFGQKLREKDGMTLLDYFAGQALVGLLASGEYARVGTYKSPSAISGESYAIAAAMLNERQSHEG